MNAKEIAEVVKENWQIDEWTEGPLLDGIRTAFEEAAKKLEAKAKKFKHTSHADGLGMGFQAVELTLHEIAEEIRELK